MIIHRTLRACLLVPFAIAGLIGCNSNQGQLLALRDECQRQMQAKDKTIDDQTQKLAEMRSQMDQLQLQSAKGSVDPEKLASEVAAAVSKELAEQARTLADLKRSVDQLSQGGGVAQSGRAEAGVAGAPPSTPVQDVPRTAPRQAPPKEVSGTSSSDHPGAIHEKFNFPAAK